jgi:hypothetical protein
MAEEAIEMSANTIMGWFVKSGPFHNLSRKFHNLERKQKEFAIGLIQRGYEPADAIKRAKREVSANA